MEKTYIKTKPQTVILFEEEIPVRIKYRSKVIFKRGTKQLILVCILVGFLAALLADVICNLGSSSSAGSLKDNVFPYIIEYREIK